MHDRSTACSGAWFCSMLTDPTAAALCSLAPDMELGLQLRAMSRTTVLITPCGGTGTVLTFLQPGATAIIMNYYIPAQNTSIQMEALYYWNLECAALVQSSAQMSIAAMASQHLHMPAQYNMLCCAMPSRTTLSQHAQQVVWPTTPDLTPAQTWTWTTLQSHQRTMTTPRTGRAARRSLEPRTMTLR